ncbi:MAG: hypothetical protein ABIR65_01165 [Pseudolysinimonas sp.]
MITDEQIAEWKRLAEAATPGPWRWSDWNATYGTLESDERLTLTGNDARHPEAQSAKRGIGGRHVLYVVDAPVTANAAFITTSRTAVPALIAEIERLRADIAFLRDEWSPFSSRPCPACVFVDGKLERHCRVHAADTASSAALVEARADVERMTFQRDALHALLAAENADRSIDIVANGGPFQVLPPPHDVEGCTTIDESIYIVRRSDLRLAAEHAARVIPPPAPVCSTCSDTHMMPLGDDYAVMCTHCPIPCQRCRSGGNGPYCTTTPCGCECHAKGGG